MRPHPENNLDTGTIMPAQQKGGSTMTTATLIAQTTKDETAILAVVESLRQSHHDKNVALFAAQFAPDAAIYNLAPPLVHHGIDRAEKQAWFDSWGTPVELEPRDFKVTVSGDLAFCHGYLRMTGTKKGASQPVNFWMRETLCLARQSDGWQIVHEHTSVPFYMDETLRPAFDLRP
jgi:ketosteroid isomerase-like protein